MEFTCQKDKFSIPHDVSYINCAYMSPNLKSVEEIGKISISKKSLPYLVQPSDFFAPSEKLKKEFAKLINVKEHQRIAIIPSASYGIATAVKNIDIQKGQNIIGIEGQFPSNYFSWKKKADKVGAEMRIISDNSIQHRGRNWNDAILNAIDTSTVVVAIPHVHWVDGTKFDLKAIRKRTNEVGAYLIVDGTQSVGALPFDIELFDVDALICGGYKWLLGPYSLGLAYFNHKFDHGEPLEENWLARKDSDNFAKLVDYEPNYKPYAHKYSVGESSNFALLPMLIESIQQLNTWGQENIQSYCENISKKAIQQISEMGGNIESSAFRGNHLFGVQLGSAFEIDILQKAFKKNNVFVSQRGNAIRIAPHVYNSVGDFEKLVGCFEEAWIRKWV